MDTHQAPLSSTTSGAFLPQGIGTCSPHCMEIFCPWKSLSLGLCWNIRDSPSVEPWERQCSGCWEKPLGYLLNHYFEYLLHARHMPGMFQAAPHGLQNCILSTASGSSWVLIMCLAKHLASEEVKWKSLSHVFATPWTVARQAPLWQASLSMEFSRQEYWSR